MTISSEKKIFWGGGTAAFPDPSEWGGDTPSPHPTSLGLDRYPTRNVWLWACKLIANVTEDIH